MVPDHHHCPRCMKAPWEIGVRMMGLYQCRDCFESGCDDCSISGVFCSRCADDSDGASKCPCCASTNVDTSYGWIHAFG